MGMVVDSGPLTPGQVSFLLGAIPVIVAWMYSEWLEYKKSLPFSKVCSSLCAYTLALARLSFCIVHTITTYTFHSCFPGSSHSDYNLVALENQTVKEDDRAILMEGGLTKSSSTKSPTPSIKTNLIRFLVMEDSFLLENRQNLRAMAEFGGILFYFYLCDRTNILPDSTKSYNRDLFHFLYLLLVITSAMTSLKKHNDKSPLSGISILYLNRHQTEEWKGYMQRSTMQVAFLLLHYICLDDWFWKLLILLH